MDNRAVYMRSGIALILICALGAILRFYNLDTQGLLRWDEGMYLLDSLNLDYININAKPFHIILVRLGIEMFGIVEYAGQMVSAMFGVVTLFLAFLIGRRLYTPATGLVFSALMAVSYNHVYFSRLTHAQSDSTFFLMLSVLLLVYHWRGSYDSSWRMVLSGAALGLAFTCHPNVIAMVIYLSLFVTILSVVKFYQTRNVSAFKDMLIFGASSAAPLLIIESGSLLAGIRAYFESAIYHAKMSATVGESVKNDYLYYYRQAIKWEGMGKVALAVPSFALIASLVVRGVGKRSADHTCRQTCGADMHAVG